MKRILLLGGFGFIGSNILNHIELFEKERYKVVVYDRFSKHPFLPLPSCVEDVFTGDFRDGESLHPLFEKYKYDIVIHSISSTVPATSKDVRFDIESNLLATIALLNIMIEHDCKNLIYISSGGAIYGNSYGETKHKESDKVTPLSSYGIVKLAVENYLYLFHRNYGLQPTILRLSNPYGPFHYSTKQGVINIAIKSTIKQKLFTVWGDGSARKDYIYVEDFCSILMSLLENRPINGLINIGSGDTLSINEILDLIGTKNVDYSSTQNFDVSHFELDIRKLKQLIPGFKFTSIEDGLQKTIEWEKAQLAQL